MMEFAAQLIKGLVLELDAKFKSWANEKGSEATLFSNLSNFAQTH